MYTHKATIFYMYIHELCWSHDLQPMRSYRKVLMIENSNNVTISVPQSHKLNNAVEIQIMNNTHSRSNDKIRNKDGYRLEMFRPRRSSSLRLTKAFEVKTSQACTHPCCVFCSFDLLLFSQTKSL